MTHSESIGRMTPLLPPDGIDEWTQGNDGISLLYGEFSIMQYSNLWEAW